MIVQQVQYNLSTADPLWRLLGQLFLSKFFYDSIAADDREDHGCEVPCAFFHMLQVPFFFTSI